MSTGAVVLHLPLHLRVATMGERWIENGGWSGSGGSAQAGGEGEHEGGRREEEEEMSVSGRAKAKGCDVGGEAA